MKIVDLMNIEELIEKIDSDLIIELTKKLVSMDSQNPPGKTKHIVEYLEKKSYELGFQTKIFPIDDERYNIVIYYGKGERDIILSGHLDTVPSGDISNWKYPPLQATEEDGLIYGRGSVDMKGGVASLLAVMELIKRSGITLKHRLVFVGTADEEVGMNGAFHLQKMGVMEKADCLIITEATNLKVGIAEKGPFWIRIKIKGKAAHGSMPEEGINAIEGACLGINQIKKVLPEISHELLGPSTLNIGIIQGGSKINVVPDECYIDCDFRLIPEIDFQNFNKQISNLLKDLSKKYPYSFSHEILHSIPALSTKRDELIIKKLLKWSKEITKFPSKPIGLTYGTDAAALIPPKDIPFAIIGGGSTSVLHQANEFVPIDDLIKAAKIIAGAIIETYGTL